MCVHSVVAITGLGGHAFGSWLSRTSTKRPVDRPMWLRDFLPQRFPNARIMTYGYDSLKESNGANITDYRRGFIQCLRNSRRQCPVSLCLTRIALRICLPFSLCHIGASHHPYRARFGRDPGCSGRRTQSVYNSHCWLQVQ